MINLSYVLNLEGRKAEAEEVERERAGILAQIEAIEAKQKAKARP